MHHSAQQGRTAVCEGLGVAVCEGLGVAVGMGVFVARPVPFTHLARGIAWYPCSQTTTSPQALCCPSGAQTPEPAMQSPQYNAAIEPSEPWQACTEASRLAQDAGARHAAPVMQSCSRWTTRACAGMHGRRQGCWLRSARLAVGVAGRVGGHRRGRRIRDGLRARAGPRSSLGPAE